jgi:hypothetical protein
MIFPRLLHALRVSSTNRMVLKTPGTSHPSISYMKKNQVRSAAIVGLIMICTLFWICGGLMYESTSINDISYHNDGSIAVTIPQIQNPSDTQSKNDETAQLDTQPLVVHSQHFYFKQLAMNSHQKQQVARIKRLRSQMNRTCNAAVSSQQMQTLYNYSQFWFRFPESLSSSLGHQISAFNDTKHVIARCKYIMLDFGANIGDTSSKLVDTGFLGCEKHGVLIPAPYVSIPFLSQSYQPKQQQQQQHQQQAQVMQILDSDNECCHNRLTRHMRQVLKLFGPDRGPEDYCYYGIEGNPVFTSRLKALEQAWMSTIPPPLAYAHFFTESVGTDQDGPTTLYLDTINADHNFWGSSLLSSHADVQKSMHHPNTSSTPLTANVMGYTLDTLLNFTSIAFDPNASASARTGGHLLVKVDIEGGEYFLLRRAAETKFLCRYIAMGNTVDAYVEYHGPGTTGFSGASIETKKATQELADCGVRFRKLRGNWK